MDSSGIRDIVSAEHHRGLLDESEKILNKEGERIDEFGDDRIEQERNALTWLRSALKDGIEKAIVDFNSSINDIYGGD